MKFFRENQNFFLAGILAIVTIACFWQVTSCNFVNFDDYDYIYENMTVQRGLSFENLIWAFTSTDCSNWHPITWISFMFDCQAAGLNPGVHHSINVVFHVLNTLLIFFILMRITSGTWQSFTVALLFAIHPLHVESVVWIAERKDVLSTFWGLMALGAYVLYTEKTSSWKLATAVLFYALSLMSKPMLVSLPFIFLLFDFWPLKRLNPGKMNFRAFYSPFIKEKVPFFILSAASCIITIIVQYKANTLLNVESSPVALRAANAFVSYVSYLLKALWPVNLSVLYPYPDKIDYLISASAFLFVIGITVAVIRKASTFPYLFVGWFWYLLTLVPVIGFVRVGFQAMADRYTYVPLIGVFIIFSWLIPDLLKHRPNRYALPISACLLIIILCPLTWKQTAYWNNSISLYEHALSVTENNYVVLSNLGVARFERGEYREALDLFAQSLKINRNNPHPFFYTGHILSKQGNYEEAIPYFRSALMLKPNYKNARTELGICYLNGNKPIEAENYFREQIKSIPNDRFANLYLANLLISKGQAEEAGTCWERILKGDPYSKEANLNLGNIAAMSGNMESAVGYFRNATKSTGDSPEARYNLGIIYAQKGNLNEAAVHLERALKLKPDYSKAHNNFGNVLLLQGKTDEAILHFREALRIDPHYSLAKQNLNDALAYKRTRIN